MNDTSKKTQIERLLSRLGIGKRLRLPVEEKDFSTTLPPFHTLQAALAMRLRTWRTLFFVTTAVLVSVVIGQQRVIFHKLFQKMNEEVIIVPGSPEFFRVRPGQIPNESVFIFAEFVANNIGTFSYRNAKYHFGKVAEHMHPIAKGRFESDTEARMKDWSERKVDQTFAYEPVRTFDLVSDERGPKYVAAVEGTRVQYVEGHAFSETRDVLLLEFRAKGNLTPEKPFLFEIESLEWLTPSQFEAVKNSRGLGKITKNEKGGAS